MLEELNEENAIPCPNDSPASSIVLESIDGASEQIASGSIITVDLMVHLLGCVEPTRAAIKATVILDMNNTFTLDKYVFQYSGGSAQIMN